MTPYNITVDPPAPFVTLQVYPFQQNVSGLSVACLLDTGADLSLIPQQLANTLKLSPASAIIVEGFDGEQQQLPLFAVDLIFETRRVAGIEVAAFPSDYAILGRDVLNRFRILLDGPNQALEFL